MCAISSWRTRGSLSISRAGDMAMVFGPQDIARAFGARTLARVPMAGGARRDVLTGVVDADWIPGTDALAVIRDPGDGGQWTVEFPVGTTVHEASAAWSLRVSPDGNRVAFFEGPAALRQCARGDGHGGRQVRPASQPSRGAWQALDWPGRHREARSGSRPRAPAKRRREDRSCMPSRSRESSASCTRAPDWVVLHDISTDGRVLLSRNTIRVNVACQAPGEATERDLGWLVQSLANGLSPDGQTLIFSDGLSGRTAAGNATVFRRSTDGSPAVSLGESRGRRRAVAGRTMGARASGTGI